MSGNVFVSVCGIALGFASHILSAITSLSLSLTVFFYFKSYRDDFFFKTLCIFPVFQTLLNLSP